jgi:hypothetical protein
LTATTADPTHNSDTTNDQSYVEANTFTNSQSAIAAGEDGLWDFSLKAASSAPQGNTYCIRPTESDGTLFSTYDVYPEVSTPQTSLNHSAYRFFENKVVLRLAQPWPARTRRSAAHRVITFVCEACSMFPA